MEYTRDRALQNTAFVIKKKKKKWWELRRMLGFSKKSWQKLSPLVIIYLTINKNIRHSVHEH